MTLGAAKCFWKIIYEARQTIGLEPGQVVDNPNFPAIIEGTRTITKSPGFKNGAWRPSQALRWIDILEVVTNDPRLQEEPLLKELLKVLEV